MERADAISDDDLRQRAEELSKEGRPSFGATVALAKELRAIRLIDRPDEQVVFIYDDPIRPANPRHAVMRVRSSDIDFVEIRTRIIEAFATTIAP